MSFPLFCIEADCGLDARCFGSLCKRHFRQQVDVPAFQETVAAEPLNDKKAREAFWSHQDRERAAFRRTIRTGTRFAFWTA